MITETTTYVRFGDAEIDTFTRLRGHIYKAYPEPTAESTDVTKMLNRLTQHHEVVGTDVSEEFTEPFDREALGRFQGFTTKMIRRMLDRQAEIEAIEPKEGSPDVSMRKALIDDYEVALAVASKAYHHLADAMAAINHGKWGNG